VLRKRVLPLICSVSSSVEFSKGKSRVIKLCRCPFESKIGRSSSYSGLRFCDFGQDGIQPAARAIGSSFTLQESVQGF
jgi:hypothetical protein